MSNNIRPANRENESNSKRLRFTQILSDCAIILLVGLVAECIVFSAPQGRAVICADSAQYVAAAEAILDPDKAPHFELRKPGFPLLLAGIKLLFGQMGWAVIVVNHLFLILLPLAAYGFGLNLHSRTLGWIAAGLTIVQLQTTIFGNRMMSEVFFTFLLSFGLLVFVIGLRKQRAEWWMVPSGILLGMAWLTRGTATAILPVIAVTIAIVYWQQWRRTVKLSTAFYLPVVAIVIVECFMNYSFSGRFRPSNGTAGATMCCTRLRCFQGEALPETQEAQKLLALLPERKAEDAFVVNLMDQWVARYRMIHDNQGNDWEFDDSCKQIAITAVKSNPGPFLWYTGKLALHYLRRRGNGLVLSPVPDMRRREIIQHAAASSREESQTYWYAYFGLPHLPQKESLALVDQIKKDAAQRAPLCDSRIWDNLRYWKSHPIAANLLSGLSQVKNLWPGFALLLCGFLGLNRTTCCVLAAAYVLEAVLIGIVTITDQRFQFIWVVTDTTLSAALPTVALAAVFRYGLHRRTMENPVDKLAEVKPAT